VRDAEARPERLRQQARARRRADQRERTQADRHHLRVHAAVDREVDAEVLHGGVDVLLDRSREPVDLVDEQDVVRLHLGERPDEVRGLGERGPARHVRARAHLRRDHVRERGLAEPGRAVEQYVLHRLGPRARRLDRDADALDEVALPHVFVDPPRAQRSGRLLGVGCLLGGGDDALACHRRPRGAQNCTTGALRCAGSSTWKNGMSLKPNRRATTSVGNWRAVAL
jgi:hypothetical protein